VYEACHVFLFLDSFASVSVGVVADSDQVLVGAKDRDHRVDYGVVLTKRNECLEHVIFVDDHTLHVIPPRQFASLLTT